MAGNVFGKVFTVTTFGESHGPATGCVIDGCPSGLPLAASHIDACLARRRPGSGPAASPRGEPDVCEILSGVYEGVTLGTPIAIIIRNHNQRSADYNELKNIYRPGHADKVWVDKYGRRDFRGGGRSSGRETAARVAAGAVASRLLAHFGVRIQAWVQAIGGITAPESGDADFSLEEAARNSLRMPSAAASAAACALVEKLRAEGDSTGGVVRCRIDGVPAGLGEPVFAKLDAALAAAMLSIGAAKGFEIGAGFSAATMTGWQNNDRPPDCPSEPPSNRAGGVLGGISTGLPIEFRVAFKPVPSIAKEQTALNTGGAVCTLRVEGRHDVCICPRAVPVVEAMSAITLAGFFLENRLARV
ncbi:MAG: chorismate synthase [Spirochaetaceae bacterium]|jgi:chorismate synthase|nr:chorismate synthase [Spirochaetaceae bacterium]